MGDVQNQAMTGNTSSYGEQAVGLTFNPSNDPGVQKVKELYAQIIDLCNDLRQVAGHGEQGRILSVAITEAQGAQMWAVKGITWNLNKKTMSDEENKVEGEEVKVEETKEGEGETAAV